MQYTSQDSVHFTSIALKEMWGTQFYFIFLSLSLSFSFLFFSLTSFRQSFRSLWKSVSCGCHLLSALKTLSGTEENFEEEDEDEDDDEDDDEEEEEEKEEKEEKERRKSKYRGSWKTQRYTI